MKKLTYILFGVIGLIAFASCSKDDDVDTTAQYYNWQAKNNVYFAKIYKQAKDEGPSNDWYIVKGYSKLGTSKTDSVVFHVLEQKNPDVTGQFHKELTDDGTRYTDDKLKCPTFTDSVTVTYRGTLMPFDEGTTYATKYNHYDDLSDKLLLGLTFDYTTTAFFGNITTIKELEEVAGSTKFTPAGVVTGFGTLLMYMHPGDRWRVFIPYQLGYGSSAKSSVPAYSTLVFDLYMKSFKTQ